MYTIYLIAIFKGCASLLQGMLGITFTQGLIIALLMIALYYAIGGLPAIIWINAIQGTLMLLGAVLLYSSLILKGGGLQIFDHLPMAVTDMNGNMILWQTTLGSAFSISLGLLALPDILIMIFSAKDKRVVRFAGVYGPVSIAIYALCVFSIGVLAHGIFSPQDLAPFMKNSGAFVPFVARTLLPSGFDGLILLAALSAAMSTISAIVLVTTTALTSDILRFVKPSITDDKMLLLTRAVGLAILAISAYVTQNVPQQIVPLASLSMGVIAACVFVPLVFGLYWKRGNGAGFVASLVASFASIVAWNFYGTPKMIHPVFIGILCGTLAYITASLQTGSSSVPSKVEAEKNNL
jgi:sodium/pantothenate symporter